MEILVKFMNFKNKQNKTKKDRNETRKNNQTPPERPYSRKVAK